MPEGFRDFDVDPAVLVQARRLGMFGNVEARIARMAKRSAKYTKHDFPPYNARFNDWLFRLEGGGYDGRVVAMARLDLDGRAVITDVLGRLKAGG